MYEFGIINTKTGERNIIFGYTQANAFHRSKLDAKDWEILYMEYVD